MTEAEKKLFRETQGLLHGCGCKLEKAEGEKYQILRCGSGKILASGTLSVCHNAAVHMVESGKFKPEPTAKGPEAYQAGRRMSKRLQGKV